VSDGLCWKRPRGAAAHGSFDWELASMRPLSLVELTSQRLGIFSFMCEHIEPVQILQRW
jgi:hypothetical protein